MASLILYNLLHFRFCAIYHLLFAVCYTNNAISLSLFSLLPFFLTFSSLYLLSSFHSFLAIFSVSSFPPSFLPSFSSSLPPSFLPSFCLYLFVAFSFTFLIPFFKKRDIRGPRLNTVRRTEDRGDKGTCWRTRAEFQYKTDDGRNARHVVHEGAS